MKSSIYIIILSILAVLAIYYIYIMLNIFINRQNIWPYSNFKWFVHIIFIYSFLNTSILTYLDYNLNMLKLYFSIYYK